jgi:putative spermidine/putrescine transport system permease protein
MVLLAVLLGLAFSAMLTRDPRQWETLWRGGFVFRLGRWKWPATALLVAVTSGTLGVLLWILVARVGMESQRVAAPVVSQAALVSGRDYVRTWSTEAALRTFQGALGSERREEWLASLLQSGLAAALAVATALPLAWWMHSRPRAAPGVGVLLGVLLAVPGPVLALGLIMLFNRPGPLGYVYDSMGILVLGLALRVWPFVLLAVWAPIRLLPRTLLDAARVDGAGAWQLFRYVQLPLSLGPALLGLLVGIALSLGELPVSLLLQRPGSMPLSVDVFNLLHAGVYNDVAAITLLLIALVFGLGAGMIVVARLMRRRLMAE